MAVLHSLVMHLIVCASFPEIASWPPNCISVNVLLSKNFTDQTWFPALWKPKPPHDSFSICRKIAWWSLWILYLLVKQTILLANMVLTYVKSTIEPKSAPWKVDTFPMFASIKLSSTKSSSKMQVLGSRFDYLNSQFTHWNQPLGFRSFGILHPRSEISSNFNIVALSGAGKLYMPAIFSTTNPITSWLAWITHAYIVSFEVQF